MTAPTLSQAWDGAATRAGEQVATVAAAYQAGSITRPRFAETAAAVTYAASSAAVAASDLAVTGWRITTTGLPTTTLGLTPPAGDRERLVTAYATVSEDVEHTAVRAVRVALSEPPNRGRISYQDALAARGVETWRRVVHVQSACEKCLPLVGQVEPIGVRLRDHPRCACSLVPIISSGWVEQQRRRETSRTFSTPSGPLRFTTGVTTASRI